MYDHIVVVKRTEENLIAIVSYQTKSDKHLSPDDIMDLLVKSITEWVSNTEDGKAAWMKYGALSYFECRGNDLVPPDMGGEKARSFTGMAGANASETVWFSFITFKSKEHRDQVNALVMEEMGKQGPEAWMEIPFDVKRMVYGGFQVEVEG